MKKITLILVALVVCMTSTFAQKYGHVNSNEIMQVMPGIDSVQIKLMDFHNSLQVIYENMFNEFQTKKDRFDKEAGTMSSAVRKLREDELIALQNRIQEFEMNVQQDIEEEKFRLIAPFQEKVQNAINDVAKEHKYNYIFDTQILLYYDGGDDVTPLVRKKLGIK
ncbi:MAG: OmpH family outer membrane protein [Bacteroidetes bacterium]|nr:OmpH family outer membrane protein [Bacteroidota bacterium]MCL2302023.1 OmpH family outer membrane protein [Lentimicrobiaceae bacterium]